MGSLTRPWEMMMAVAPQKIYRVALDGRVLLAVEEQGERRELVGDLFGNWRAGPVISPSARILPPIVPSKIVAVGLNYRDHAAERGKDLPEEPLIFLKPPSAIIGSGDAIRLPAGAGRVDHEAEVGVVIKKRAYRVDRARAFEHVLGITALNDVTARDLQRRDIQVTRAKGFDTFCPLGPCIMLSDASGETTVEAWVNGIRRQSSSTGELIFPIDYLIAFVSSVMTLVPGDVISTGTPAGVGPLAPGDTVTVRVGGVGDLTNQVVSA